MKVHPAFGTHELNARGTKTAEITRQMFQDFHKGLMALEIEGQSLAIITAKLEEACSHAFKAIAESPLNQEPK